MKQTKIGQVIHYFDKINVAIVKLTKGDLKIGDSVKLTDKEGNEFVQEVDSMQIEHASIDIAKAGDEFGLKVKKEIRSKSEVFKL
jgi:translation elongation factor EF-1alpha